MTFKPTAAGVRTATVTFSTTESPTPGAGSTLVMLSGTGAQPAGQYVLVARAVNTKSVATRKPALVRLRIFS